MSNTSRLDRLLSKLPPDLADTIAVSRLMFRITALLEARIDAALADDGLSMREYLALVLIADNEVEPLRPSDLSLTLDATRTQVTRLLDGLEQKGWVDRQPDEGDRRTLQVAITESGRKRLRKVMPKVHAIYADTWAPLGIKDTHKWRALLGQVYGALSPKVGA